MIGSTLAVTVVSLTRKKVSVFTLFSGIYLLMTIANINAAYLREILLIVWSLAHFYFIKQEKINDLFKFLVYASVLLLYNTVIRDLGLNIYTVFSMLRIYRSFDAYIKNNTSKTHE